MTSEQVERERVRKQALDVAEDHLAQAFFGRATECLDARTASGKITQSAFEYCGVAQTPEMYAEVYAEVYALIRMRTAYWDIRGIY